MHLSNVDSPSLWSRSCFQINDAFEAVSCDQGDDASKVLVTYLVDIQRQSKKRRVICNEHGVATDSCAESAAQSADLEEQSEKCPRMRLCSDPSNDYKRMWISSAPKLQGLRSCFGGVSSDVWSDSTDEREEIRESYFERQGSVDRLSVSDDGTVWESDKDCKRKSISFTVSTTSTDPISTISSPFQSTCSFSSDVLSGCFQQSEKSATAPQEYAAPSFQSLVGVRGRGHDIRESTQAEYIRRCGVSDWKDGNYEKALNCFNHALTLTYHQPSAHSNAEKHHPLLPDQDDIAETYYWMGIVYTSLGEYSYLALWYLQRSLELRLETRGTCSDPEVARTYIAIAKVKIETGHTKQATKLLEKSICVLNSTLGQGNIYNATALTSLGAMYDKMGKDGQAAKAYYQALKIFNFDERYSNDVGVTLNNIGRLYERRGELQGAEEAYGDALAILIKSLGHCHRNVAATYYNLASSFSRQGKFDEALEMLQNALDIQQDVFSKSHVDIACTLDSMADIQYELGQHDVACRLCSEALNLRELCYGPHHLFVAISLSKLGKKYLGTKKHEGEAEVCISRALELYKKFGMSSQDLLFKDALDMLTNMGCCSRESTMENGT